MRNIDIVLIHFLDKNYFVGYYGIEAAEQFLLQNNLDPEDEYTGTEDAQIDSAINQCKELFKNDLSHYGQVMMEDLYK